MSEILSEKIEVEKAETSPMPVRFIWRGREHSVAEILKEWVDTGFGSTPPGSRRWYNRRRRRYFVVRDAAGEVFEMYLDYHNPRKPEWWLVRKVEKESG
jgi:hypothetical protein